MYCAAMDPTSGSWGFGSASRAVIDVSRPETVSAGLQDAPSVRISRQTLPVLLMLQWYIRVRKQICGGLKGYSVGKLMERKKMPDRREIALVRLSALEESALSARMRLLIYRDAYLPHMVYPLAREGPRPTRKGYRRSGLLNSSVAVLLSNLRALFAIFTEMVETERRKPGVRNCLAVAKPAYRILRPTTSCVKQRTKTSPTVERSCSNSPRPSYWLRVRQFLSSCQPLRKQLTSCRSRNTHLSSPTKIMRRGSKVGLDN